MKIYWYQIFSAIFLHFPELQSSAFPRIEMSIILSILRLGTQYLHQNDQKTLCFQKNQQVRTVQIPT